MRKKIKQIVAKTLTFAMTVSVLSGTMPVNVAKADTLDGLPTVEITAPVAGAKAETSVTVNGENVELQWTGELTDGKFKCATVYSVEYTLSAGDDNDFNASLADDDDTDGKTVTLSADSKTATVHTTYTATADYTGGTATCQNQATCSVCGEAYGELDKNNHEGEKEFVPYSAPTCTKAGNYAHFKCGCGAVFDISTVGDHKSTATEAGELAAGDAYAEGFAISATGTHAGNKVSDAVTATCQTKGQKAVYQCDTCHEY